MKMEPIHEGNNSIHGASVNFVLDNNNNFDNSHIPRSSGLPTDRDFDSDKEQTQIFYNYEYDMNTYESSYLNEIHQETTQESDKLSQTTSYPAWNNNNLVPISEERISQIFEELGNYFGFQPDSVANMLDHFMIQLDSRSSRMNARQALISLHADYIGGEHANYRKWYFAAILPLDDQLASCNTKKRKKKSIPKTQKGKEDCTTKIYSLEELEDMGGLLAVEFNWKQRMASYTIEEYVYQVALYLLLWGEANQIRFVPECLCFLFKCAFDYFFDKKENTMTGNIKTTSPQLENFDYLERVINPLYNYIWSQQFDISHSGNYRTEKDHSKIVGYDDINQLFWYSEGLRRIKLKDGSSLLDYNENERYLKLGEVKWEDVFYKTYKEKRTWLHLTTNFSRIWTIHLTMYWYYTCFNSPTLYTANYSQVLDNQPTHQVTISAMALGGAISCTIQILSILSEWCFVPREWPGSAPLATRLFFLIVLLLLNALPSVYIIGFFPLDVYSKSAFILSVVQLCISFCTFLYFAFQPSGALFRLPFTESSSPSEVFVSSFPKLKGKSKLFSYSLWILVFGAKFSESYFFLTLSLRDPIRNLSIMEMSRCIGDSLFGNVICKQQARFLLVLLYITDLILFFLDTYLWYIICNCIFSVGLAMYFGMSIMTPWRNIFTRLPKRIYSKIIFVDRTSQDIKKPKILVSQVWNAIVMSMYKEHLFSVDQVYRLIYTRTNSDIPGRGLIKSPSFFVYQDDSNFTLTNFFLPESEAERRISFFAQSLSTTLPEPISTQATPIFTVIIPHYSEKIVLTLKEIIKEDSNSRLSLLEYLKNLYPTEWDCFVKDTKVFAQQELSTSLNLDETEINTKANNSDLHNLNSPLSSPAYEQLDFFHSHLEDLPFYCIGFKSSSPEYALRTRIWASLRTQTLYRTVSGFMNYQHAIKLLNRIEDPITMDYWSNYSRIIRDSVLLSERKFHMIIAMQRFQKFTEEESANAKILFRAFPGLRVAYLEEVRNNDTLEYYSTLLDISQIEDNGEYRKKYRVKLSGYPILGDGKSDNQNNALIYYRGEYIQVIDANQDNYLEECLKIRSVLAEFEELYQDPSSPYVPGICYKGESPVAIVGAREYIFSENTGVLGDVAAGKEKTFGTLFSRTLAEIGGKLHYGHPDFLNAIFMTTRGGISKAQKGLHLNEDIYAGINAVLRGGRIKHCDYYQCGKGRDLGFGSILNFTTKIGAGMGEQLLSREYYYLGTQLPLDRFLSFYYAHPGFHLNNLLIMLSVQLFMLVLVNLGSLAHESIICLYDKNLPITNVQEPLGCYNLSPVLDWVTRFVLSVFICFFISFVPLVIHELTERGITKAFTRILFHFISFAPLFEVFVCQIYSHSLKDDLTSGTARYISTGRGFAMARIPFSTLYSRYAPSSIYSGSMLFLTVLFGCICMWHPALLWFWITFISMCLSPFLFNPHQFSWSEFILDYRDFIRWLNRGNSRWHHNSWIRYTRKRRSRFTGYKRMTSNSARSTYEDCYRRTPFLNAFTDEVFLPLLSAGFVFFGYSFINSQNGVKRPEETSHSIRLLVLVFLPIVLNSLVILLLFPVSVVLGPLFSYCNTRAPGFIALMARGISLLIHILNFEIMFLLEGWNFPRALLCFICVIMLQKVIFSFLTITILSRELEADYSNRAWWSGIWITNEIGWHFLTQPFREVVVKMVEQHYFAADFILGHCILFSITPFMFIPYIDRWHSDMLFWLTTNRQFRNPIISLRRRKKQHFQIIKYLLLYISMIILFAGMIAIPIVCDKLIPRSWSQSLPTPVQFLIQPNKQMNNDTGPNRATPLVLRSKPELAKAWKASF